MTVEESSGDSGEKLWNEPEKRPGGQWRKTLE
jgi:hypothetical protein